MGNQDLVQVVDIEGHTVSVVSESMIRSLGEKLLKWIFTTGIILSLAAVGAWTTLKVDGNDLKRGQEQIVQRLDEYSKRSPAPADTTRIALTSLQRQLDSLEVNVRRLRRELRRPE